MAEIKTQLDDVIEKEIERVDSLPPGEDRAQAIKDLTALHKLRVDEVKAEQGTKELACKERELEDSRTQADALAQRQVKETRVDRCFRAGIAVVELVLPLMFYGTWMKRGLKFEETGSFTSTTFKNLLSKFRPTK